MKVDFMLPTPIDNDGLRQEDVPPRTAEWKDIVNFAQTFNGYKVHGSFEACAAIANERRQETLTELRTCLFFEQRRWNHFGHSPDADAMEYIQSLLDEIRKRVSKANC